MPDEMHVAKLASGAMIVVSHPGREKPSDEALRRELGIVDPSIVKPLSDTDARPANNDEIAAAGGAPRQARGDLPRTAKRPAPGA